VGELKEVIGDQGGILTYSTFRQGDSRLEELDSVHLNSCCYACMLYVKLDV